MRLQGLLLCAFLLAARRSTSSAQQLPQLPQLPPSVQSPTPRKPVEETTDKVVEDVKKAVDQTSGMRSDTRRSRRPTPGQVTGQLGGRRGAAPQPAARGADQAVCRRPALPARPGSRTNVPARVCWAAAEEQSHDPLGRSRPGPALGRGRARSGGGRGVGRRRRPSKRRPRGPTRSSLAVFALGALLLLAGLAGGVGPERPPPGRLGGPDADGLGCEARGLGGDSSTRTPCASKASSSRARCRQSRR